MAVAVSMMVSFSHAFLFGSNTSVSDGGALAGLAAVLSTFEVLLVVLLAAVLATVLPALLPVLLPVVLPEALASCSRTAGGADTLCSWRRVSAGMSCAAY
jgi:hypothetical protein